jgi:predicted adenylyl cyclase CyaB
LETQHQVDTYFQCRRGRLKLREINDQRAELIWYERANQKQPTASHYGLVPVDDPMALKQALAATVGIRVIVEKQREIYLHHNVRIHLDRVVDLGTYLEFESVLSDDIDAKSGTAQVNFLIGEFGIAEDDLCTGSYAEMLEEHDW